MYENDRILGFHTDKLKDYRIIEEIGEGGSSHVYSAYYENLNNQKRVIKVSKNISRDDGSREAAVLTSLRNPYIPIIYEYFIEGDRAILVMEYIAGDSVQQKIKAGYLFSRDEVYKYGRQLCEVVNYLHSLPEPIIHGDIKPDNVIITPAGKICLIDFNISGISHDGKAYTNGYTKGYGAPEQRDAFYALKKKKDNESKLAAGVAQPAAAQPVKKPDSATMPVFGETGTLDLYHLPDGFGEEKTVGLFGNSGQQNPAPAQEHRTVQLLGDEFPGTYGGSEKTELFNDAGKGTEFLPGALPDEQSLRTKSESIGFTGSNEAVSGYGIEIDKRSDVYSIGATLFRMYFCDKDKSVNRIDRFHASGHEKVAGKGVHEGLLFVIDKALQDNPNKRYQSAGEMLKALEKIKAGKKYEKVLGMIMPASALTTILIGIVVIILGGTAFAVIKLHPEWFEGNRGSSDIKVSDRRKDEEDSDDEKNDDEADEEADSDDEKKLEDEQEWKTALGKMETARSGLSSEDSAQEYKEALILLNTLKKSGYEKDPVLNAQIILCHLEMDNINGAKDVLNEVSDILDADTRREIENRIEIVENKQNIESLLQLGTKYFDEEDYISAKEAFEEASEAESDNIEAGAGLAKAYIKLGNLNMAQEMIGKLSDADDKTREDLDKAYSEEKSAIEQMIKDADSASKSEKEAKYREVIDEYPEYAEGYDKLIDYYLGKEKADKKTGKLKKTEGIISQYFGSLGSQASGAVLKTVDKYLENITIDSLIQAKNLINQYGAVLDDEDRNDYLGKIEDGIAELNKEEEEPTPEPEPTGVTPTVPPTPTPKQAATPTPKPAATATPTPKPTSTPVPSPTPAPLAKFLKQDVNLGATVKYGKYAGSDITWIVYKYDKNAGTIYLLSEYVLTNEPFSEDGTYYWNTFNSNDKLQINIWLNTKFVEDFKNKDRMIRPTNAFSGNENRQGISERVYLLDKSEWNDVVKALSKNDNLTGKTKSGKAASWWLREKYNDTDVLYVKKDSTETGHAKVTEEYGIRPAIIVNVD